MDASWTNGLLGGLLIGSGAAVLLLGNGRIAGAVGILRGVLSLRLDADWLERALFLLALVGVPLALSSAALIEPLTLEAPLSLPLMAAGGLIVGIGTRLGNGCTSGHGVCGLSRLSLRSLVATATFMSLAALTTTTLRHAL